MTIVKDRKILAVYLEDEVICPSCAAAGEQTIGLRESIQAEELEGIIDELWCDRCGEEILTFHSSPQLLLSGGAA
jgi:hypothetical protein